MNIDTQYGSGLMSYRNEPRSGIMWTLPKSGDKFCVKENVFKCRKNVV